jgi:D-alanyl-D-alanine carboxypeptidase
MKFRQMPDSQEYLRRIQTIHRELGIPLDYALARKLTPYMEASDLVMLDPGSDTKFRLAPRAAVRWREMKDVAAQDNVELLLISGFRSVDRQREIIQAKLAQGIDLRTILTVLAAPGFSQHHTGSAIDIGTPGHPALSEEFENTAAFQWLASHAQISDSSCHTTAIIRTASSMNRGIGPWRKVIGER